jgi:HEAT repeat protein
MTFNYRTRAMLFAVGGWLILAGSAAWAAESVASLAAKLGDKSPAVRAQAAAALGELGESAKTAGPALLELLKDPDETVRRQAVKALVAIRPGPEIMQPAFVKIMTDSDPASQMRIMQAVAEAGEAAVPGLIKALQNEKLAYWACIVLREIGPSAKAAVPALIETLKSPRPDVRREAVLALGAMDDAAAPATAQIAELLSDEHAAMAATFVLAQLGKIPADAEAKIRENTKSDDKTLATVSLWAIVRVHPEDKELRREATEKIVECLKDKDPFVRVAAARALGALPPAPEITLPILEKMLKDSDAATAQYALDALASIGPKAVPRLIELLKHKDLRVQVVYILGQIGPGAAPAVEELAKLINEQDKHLATETVIAIGKIGPDAKSAVPALTKALGQQNCPNAHAIIYTLGRIGPNAVAAEPLLINALKGKDRSLIVVAAWALAKIDPGAIKRNNVVAFLVYCLTDSLPETRKAAAEGLADLGPTARDAAPALKKALGDESKDVREAVAKALQKIGQ